MHMTDSQHRRFVFRRLLGKGGFGEVYLSDMTIPSGLTSTVAVKVLHDKLDPESQAVRRLKDEGRILSMLNHPSIVKVFDLAHIEGRVALVTEFIDGLDLLESLKGDDPMPRGARFEAMAQIADALHAAHGATDSNSQPLGLLHRDVKPANVRVGRHGEVKLLDFGIATGAGLDRQANTGRALVGSFPYMAPERFQRGNVEASSDYYSLGCTLFEVLTGTRLFEQTELSQLVVDKTQEDRHDEKVAGQLQAHAVEPRAATLLASLIAWSPSRRPDATEIIASLEDLAAEAGGDRLSRWARTHTWPNPNPVRGSLSGLTIEEMAVQDVAPQPPPVLPAPRSKAPWLAAVVLGGGAILFISLIAGALVAGVGLGWMNNQAVVAIDPAPDGTPDLLPEPAAPEPTLDPEPDPRTTPEPGPTPEPTDPSVPDPTSIDGVAAIEPTPRTAQGEAPDCGDTVALEGSATSGSMSAGERACLAGVAHQASLKLVDRRRAGRVVLVDARARCSAGNGCSDYEREQAYFFEELDRSDAEMMLAWGRHLAKISRHSEARIWFSRALERKEQWRGRSHIQRVSATYEGDARSAYALWSAKPRDEPLRIAARNAATTWASYAAQVGRNPKPAMDLCISAAGSEAACTSRVHDGAATVEIVVTSRPAGALVTIDGTGAGTTPLTRSLSFGAHTLGITLDGVDSEVAIEVGSEQPVRWAWTKSDGTWTSAF